MLDLDLSFAYWLAGLLEGEGSFKAPPPSTPKIPCITLNMTDEDIVAKMARAFSLKYFGYKHENEIWKPYYILNLTGKRAIELMQMLKPVLSIRRQQQITKAIAAVPFEVEPPTVQLEMPEPNSPFELCWLAGLLEGEGSFLPPPPSEINRPIIQMWSTDEDIIARVAKIWELNHYATYERGGNAKTAYFVLLRGKRAVEYMLRLKPMMGIRRQQQIEAAIQDYDPDRNRKLNMARSPLTEAQVSEVKRRLRAGDRVGTLAKAYAVNYKVIEKIAKGKTWVWVE